ncbi:peptidase dimerization domain-containing protein, partial [Pseudomonas sp. SIMBA_065]
HVGQIVGGKALNIVPNLCTLDFEVRNLPADDLEHFLEQLRERAEVLFVGQVRHAGHVDDRRVHETQARNALRHLDDRLRALLDQACTQYAQHGFITSIGVIHEHLNAVAVPIRSLRSGTVYALS